jgi:hypothetical protein
MSPKPTVVPQQPSLSSPATPANRMSMASVTRGKRAASSRIVLHGTEGVGKSTFASEAPAPIFLAAEDGVRFLDVATFPEPLTFDDVLAAVETLIREDHEFKTLVIDTVDWVGHLLKDKVRKANNWTPADFDKYGRGFKVWVEDWRKLLSVLDRLRAKKGMEIILVVHTRVGNFKNPAGEDYGRYQLAIGGEEAPELLKQWADVILFATHEEFTTDPKKGRIKGVSTGQRLIHTERTAAWDAKHRFGLNFPSVLPLDYAAFDSARAGGEKVDPAPLAAECFRLADALEIPFDDKRRASLEANRENPELLVRALNSLRAAASEAGIQ